MIDRPPQSVDSFDGTRLAVWEEGPRDAPPLVLVSGLGLSVGAWGGLPQMLASDHRVIVYDPRGHGSSGNAAGGRYDLWAHARDLGTVLERLVADGRRAVVVGHSFGGAVVVAHAHHSADHRMAGAVLLGSSAASITLPGLPAKRLPRLRAAALLAWLAGLRLLARLAHRSRSLDRVTEAMVRLVSFEPDAPREAVHRIRDEFFASRPGPLARTALAGGAHDGPRLASSLDVPTLVVRGARDRQVSRGDVRHLLESIPDAQAVELPGVGHIPALTDPDGSARHITRWAAIARDGRFRRNSSSGQLVGG